MKFLIQEVKTELSSIEIYSLFSKEKNTIFLDGLKEDSEYSNYSFIGINPYKTFKSYGKYVEIDNKIKKGNAFDELEKLMNQYKIENDIRIPLVAGALGYFSYDISRILEDLPDKSSKDYTIPDSYFLFFDNIIIFDLKNNKKYISAMGILKDSKESIDDIYRKISNAKIKTFENSKVKSVFKKENSNEGCKKENSLFLKDLQVVNKDKEKNFYSNFSKETYIQGVKMVKDYIKSGDAYIINLTQRLWCDCEADGFCIYSKLREENKAPFSCYLNLDEFEIISSSPERFLNVYDSKVATRPIKGTRPRGATKEEDEANKLELINSEKDKSELLMIVDLERNDLSKVCRKNTVKVEELFKLEEYPTVFHLASTISGNLNETVSSIRCMKECFPGGSITGAPKIRSMEIIEELEGIKRGIYTGSIGYFDFRGNCDFNIVIRSILKKNDKAYFSVGGGVTIDSIEEMEYEETLDKAKALIEVLD